MATDVSISSREVRFGEDLVKAGYLSNEALASALELRSRSSDQPLRHILLDQSLITEEQLTEYFAERYQMQTLDLTEIKIAKQAIECVPYALCTRFGLVPVRLDGDELTVAISDPLTYVPAEQSLQQETGKRICLTLGSSDAIDHAMRRHYQDENLGEHVQFIMDDGPQTGDEAEEAEADLVAHGSASSTLDNIMAQAIMRRASDVHLEPGEQFVKIRFRIDGAMTDIISLPRQVLPGLVGRIKVAAQLDIGERRLPQDGTIVLQASGRSIDLRVSTMPTIYGERIVLRILDKTGGPADLRSIGMAKDVLAAFKLALDAPHGLNLVTGPTGSGKTTTLYAALQYLSKPGVNILTVEDPVEYKIEGISQVQTKNKIGYDFARALEAFLRQDPDVILVGEIRNEETAHVAVQASMTGHLVLSTLHMNSAAEALTRLIEMGVKQYVVGSTLRSVLAQRLVRKLCKKCKLPDTQNTAFLERFGIDPESAYRAGGCDKCGYTGYSGRLAINELLVVDEELRAVILGRATAAEVEKIALANGMQSLAQDALRKLALGQTGVDDILSYLLDVPGT